MKKYLPYLLVLLVLLFSAWDYHQDMEQARANFRRECHEATVLDIAQLEESLRLLQAVLEQFEDLEVVNAVQDEQEEMPAEVNSLVRLLTDKLQLVALYVSTPDLTVLWRVVARQTQEIEHPVDSPEVTEPHTKIEDKTYLTQGPFPVVSGEPGFLYTRPIATDDRIPVGYVSAFVPCSAVTKRLSSGVFAVRQYKSNLTISGPQFLAKGTIYNETVKSESFPWEIQASRPDSAFWERTDVQDARRSAAVNLLSLALSVVAAMLWYRQRSRAAQARYRSTFMGTLSHEARRFLQRITALAEMSSQLPEGKIQQRLLARVEQASQSLLGLVDDNADMACIEADAVKLGPRPVALRDLLHRTTSELAEAAGQKQVALICWIDTKVPDHVVVDGKRLGQALHCLLDNAVKFTDSGEISLKVVPTAGGLRFAVRDSGCGIPQAEYKTIFQPYHQLAPRPGENPPGAGLGLAICSRLVAEMGGELEVESSSKRGSVFWFTLPLRGEPPEELPVPEALRQARLAVLEQQDTHYRRLKSILKSVGLEHERAVIASSLETLGDPPGILITQPTKALYELELKDWKILVVLEPGPRAQRQVSRYRERGCEVLWKPYSERQLLDALGTLVEGERYTPLPETKLDPMVPHLRLVLAEVDPIHRAFSLRWLNSLGHDVVVTEDGESVARLAEEGNLDLIVLTLPLENLDGLEVIRRLRTWEKKQARPHTPVLVLLPSYLGRDRTMCLKAGADAVLAKPFGKDEFQLAIRGLLSETVMERPRGVVVPRANTLVFDPELALERAGGDPDSLRELIELALDTTPTLLGNAKEACAKQNGAQLDSALQGLGCLAETFACHELRKTLELWAQDPWAQSLEELGQQVRELTRSLKEFMANPSPEGLESEGGLPAVAEGGSGLKPLRGVGSGSGPAA